MKEKRKILVWGGEGVTHKGAARKKATTTTKQRVLVSYRGSYADRAAELSFLPFKKVPNV